MTTPKHRTTVGLSTESREKLEKLVETTNSSIREVIEDSIDTEYSLNDDLSTN